MGDVFPTDVMRVRRTPVEREYGRKNKKVGKYFVVSEKISNFAVAKAIGV